MTEQEQDENLKSCLDLIEKWGDENKPPTLKERLMEWYGNANLCQSNDVITNEIVNIVAEWLPPSHPTNDYKWEQCLKLMREKLR
jgi:hypothetical protein